MIKDIDEKILNATLETIAREKISGTRMHQIAQLAGTSQSNLHYHFPTKNALLLAVLDTIQSYFSKKRKNYIDLEHRSFRENLHALFEEKKDDVLHHKEVDCVQFDYLVQGTVDPVIRKKFQTTFEIWRGDIAAVFRQSGLPEDVCREKIRTFPYLMVSLMIGASMQAMIDEKHFDVDAYFQEAEAIVLRECGCDAGTSGKTGRSAGPLSAAETIRADKEAMSC